MPLSTLEADTIRRAARLAKKVLEEVRPVADFLNIIYDSAGGVKTTITQAELDEDARLSGLTKAQLDDGMFVLTSTLRTAITNAVAQLAHLAARQYEAV